MRIAAWSTLVALAGCGTTSDKAATPSLTNDSSLTADVVDADAVPLPDTTSGFDVSNPPEVDPPSDGKPSAPNLVPNFDFELGNTMFGSDYAFAAINSIEGEYTVGKSGKAFNGALIDLGDHTSGKGLMFIGNGKSTPDRVWFTLKPIAVTPGTKYYFEAWVMNLCCTGYPGPQGPSVLSFYANDKLLATRTSSKLGTWEGMSSEWNSGTAVSVTLKLINANTDPWGNDFAVDDIYLGTVSTVLPPPK